MGEKDHCYCFGCSSHHRCCQSEQNVANFLFKLERYFLQDNMSHKTYELIINSFVLQSTPGNSNPL